MVVQDYYNGSCHIKINDQYCRDTTQEQIDAAAKRIGCIYRESETKRMLQKQLKK